MECHRLPEQFRLIHSPSLVTIWLSVGSETRTPIGCIAGLTYLPLVSHICVSGSSQRWFRKWPVAYSAPSHYLNQYWVIVNWNLTNKLQWNFNRNTRLCIHENAFETPSAKWRPFYPGEDELMIGWSKDSLGKLSLTMHNGLAWPVGISASFKSHWQSSCTAQTSGK